MFKSKKKLGPRINDDTQELAFDLPNLSSDNYWPGLLILSSVENATPIQTLWLDNVSVLLFTFWKILFVESVAFPCNAPVRTPPPPPRKSPESQTLSGPDAKDYKSVHFYF